MHYIYSWAYSSHCNIAWLRNFLKLQANCWLLWTKIIFPGTDDTCNTRMLWHGTSTFSSPYFWDQSGPPWLFRMNCIWEFKWNWNLFSSYFWDHSAPPFSCSYSEYTIKNTFWLHRVDSVWSLREQRVVGEKYLLTEPLYENLLFNWNENLFIYWVIINCLIQAEECDLSNCALWCHE